MLAAIHADQLPRHSRRIEQKPKRRSHIRAVRATSQNGVLPLCAEMLFCLSRPL